MPLLVGAGADINACDAFGCTVLYFTSGAGDPEAAARVVGMLLAKGADPAPANSEWGIAANLLLWAVAAGQFCCQMQDGPPGIFTVCSFLSRSSEHGLGVLAETLSRSAVLLLPHPRLHLPLRACSDGPDGAALCQPGGPRRGGAPAAGGGRPPQCEGQTSLQPHACFAVIQSPTVEPTAALQHKCVPLVRHACAYPRVPCMCA